MVGLDEESLTMVPAPCMGIIFLYPFSQVETRKKRLGSSRGLKSAPGVWFMDQTIGNACGAVALMHCVMNCMDRVSKDSSFLQKFRSDAKNANALIKLLDSNSKLYRKLTALAWVENDVWDISQPDL